MKKYRITHVDGALYPFIIEKRVFFFFWRKHGWHNYPNFNRAQKALKAIERDE